LQALKLELSFRPRRLSLSPACPRRGQRGPRLIGLGAEFVCIDGGEQLTNRYPGIEVHQYLIDDARDFGADVDLRQRAEFSSRGHGDRQRARRDEGRAERRAGVFGSSAQVPHTDHGQHCKHRHGPNPQSARANRSRRQRASQFCAPGRGRINIVHRQSWHLIPYRTLTGATAGVSPR
jgi:hypothetical protein